MSQKQSAACSGRPLQKGLALLAVLALCGSLLLAGPAAPLGATPEWDVNQNSANALARAYGYCRGQALTASRVAAAFAQLAPAMRRAEIIFRGNTGDVCGEIEALLRQIFGADGFAKVQAQMDAELDRTLGRQPMTEDLAEGFVGQVEARASWEIEHPMLETMLAVHYRGDPAGEMREGHTQDFDSTDHPKADGIAVQLSMPRSWRAVEGKRPHIVQFWTSQYGSGTATMHLDIRSAGDHTPTMAEVAADVANGLAGFLPEGATLRDGGSFEIENQPGVWVSFDTTETRIDLMFDMRSAYYMLFFDGHAVSLMCQTGMPHEAASAQPAMLGARFERLLPLCRAVLNTLVLPQVYLR